MNTDETARAILDWGGPIDTTIKHPAYQNPTYVTDLQAMAKLWLMRDEIIDTLNNADENGTWELDEGCKALQRCADLRDKLNEVIGE